MKKLITAAFTLLLGTGAFAQPNCPDFGWDEEPIADPDGCCVIFDMLETDDYPWAYWFVEANGELYTSFDYPDGNFEVCYDVAGSYNVIPTYVNAANETMCQNNWTVTAIVDCVCKFNFCWSSNDAPASMQAFEELIGVKVVDLDGNETDYVLFDPALDITGNYDEILDAFIEVFVNEEKLDEDAVGEGGTNCFKGDYPQPGFSVTGKYASVSFYGIDDDGNEIEVFFENSCEPERKMSRHVSDDDAPFSNESTVNVTQFDVVAVPNPADDIVAITILNPTNDSEVDLFELIIFDVNGRQVYRGNTTLQSQQRIDVSSFERGLYIYEVRDGETVLLKEKLLLK